MDIRGGYAKPNWTDILWVQLVLLPYTSVRLVPYCLQISAPNRFKLVKVPQITLIPKRNKICRMSGHVNVLDSCRKSNFYVRWVCM